MARGQAGTEDPLGNDRWQLSSSGSLFQLFTSRDWVHSILMAKDKIHPVWYSEFIPIMFFVSSIFAGLSMVIFEGSISQKVFSDQISETES
ncbi:MAG: hypothetical protein MZV63_00905 [Marinilabiliales bacterium]|nr:hypothetical protein [Marinilabiliales bacterium]